MFAAVSMAASGIRSQQSRIDVVANNVANINTIAFKSARLDFQDSLYVTGHTPGPARSPDENQQKGHGVTLAAISRSWTNGNFQRTERDLDFAIQGDGFFLLENPTGGFKYTRSGNFALSAEPGGLFLVNGEGSYVLNSAEGRIMVPPETTRIEVDTEGNIGFIGAGNELLGTTQLGVFTFRNTNGLEAIGDSNFIAGPAAGDRLPAVDIVIRQGGLEGSNVDLATEMTKLIRTQRAFQLASRALTTADEMEGIANNMRRA